MTGFRKSGKFPQIGMHSLSRDTRLWKRVITIIKGNASASTQPLMKRCTLKNRTYTSIFCISILLIFTCLILLKVWCYVLLFSHSNLVGFVVYDTFLWPKLNVNTFRTHPFIYSHFYLMFSCYVFTYFEPCFSSMLPMIVVFWQKMGKVNAPLYLRRDRIR